jgi:proton-dependent oligopeptide transporter, POT family
MNVEIQSGQLEPTAAADHSGIAGHPRGLTTLFFTEMWERFSYYGMKAILVLYTTAAVAQGGLAFDNAHAGRVIALYTSSVYWTPLIGGWLADKLLGTRLAVLIGGIIIAAGHYSMIFHSHLNFYAGLTLIALGTGLLKPNMSAMVGQLYTPGDERRDAGFSIFYMGINIGALIAPLVCGFLAQDVRFKRLLIHWGFDPRTGWHWGFGAAGVGMTLGLVQYVLSGKRLRGIGKRQPKTQDDKRDEVDLIAIASAIAGGIIGFTFCYAAGGRDMTSLLLPTVVGIAFGFVGAICRHLSAPELRRVGVIFILFVFSMIFWMSFEQGATSLNLFADRLTRTSIFGFNFPSSWFQSVQPGFVILLAPVFAALWVRLGRRDPSSPTKFAFGLLFAGLAFSLVTLASRFAGGAKVSPWWLVGVYFLQTLGELCLSPVGLSTITKLSPGRLVGLMMGVWFLSTSLADFIAGRVLTFFDEKAPGTLFKLFGITALITFIAALVLFLLVPLIRPMIGRPDSE